MEADKDGQATSAIRRVELIIRDGKLNFQEFAAMVENTDIVK